ncbi:MAG: lytic transglycosylase domain-containing protein [Acidobacteria bacterium]|nr:lytic transglycosylase domain-containing protein [Acidobacteriota bacterium]
MKRSLPLVASALLLLSAAAARAQQPTPHSAFDNFDFEGGVRVAPTPAPRKFRMTAMHRAELERSAPRVRLTLAPYDATAQSLPMSPSASLDGFTTGDAKVDSLIVGSGKRNGVDPVLLYAIMHRESSFKRYAVSYKGARGLMQLMPGTAARFGVRDIFDPAQNIEGGARYVRFLLERFGGDVRLALAGYNAGEGAVDRYDGVPPYRETQDYVRRIGERYQLMRNPEVARVAQSSTLAQAAAANNAAPVEPLYERSATAVRLPDGRLMLISQ